MKGWLRVESDDPDQESTREVGEAGLGVRLIIATEEESSRGRCARLFVAALDCA